MHRRTEEFVAEAGERYGIEVDVHEFPEGTKTAEDAAEAIGCDVAQIGSSLVFVSVDDGEPVVVITSGANRVDEAALSDLVGGDVRMAAADEVRSATGWSIGGVPPFCHARELPVYIDETLLDHDEVWVAAGTPQAVFPIDPDRLVELSGATPADVVE